MVPVAGCIVKHAMCMGAFIQGVSLLRFARARRPGICDLAPADRAVPNLGKVELDALDDDGGQVIERIVRSAVLEVFRSHLDIGALRGVLDAFDDGRVVDAGEDVAAADEVALSREIPALRDAVVALVGDDERPGVVASAVELVLEGLHLSKRLNKDADRRGTRASYRAR